MRKLIAGSAVLALFYFVANVEAASTTFASISLRAELSSLDISPGTKQFASSDFDDTADAEDKHASASIPETYKYATSNLSGSSHASIGDLGIKFSGTAHSDPASPPFGGPNSSVQYDVFSQTFWSDVLRLDLHNASASVPTIIHANLSIGGGFSFHTSGDRPGTFNASLYLSDLSGTAGFPPTLPPAPLGTDVIFGGIWALAVNSNIVQPPHLIPVTLAATNHQDIEFVYKMSVSAHAGSGIGDLDMAGDFSGSLHWAGIESVTDTAGNIVPESEWSLTSGSGFDYKKPFGVPEPTSASLLLLGVCCRWVSRPRRLGAH